MPWLDPRVDTVRSGLVLSDDWNPLSCRLKEAVFDARAPVGTEDGKLMTKDSGQEHEPLPLPGHQC